MPIYNYVCQDCGRQVEAIVMRGDAEPTQCEACQGKLARLLAAPADYRQLRTRPPGKTCCGRDERCATPPCSGDSGCCSS